MALPVLGAPKLLESLKNPTYEQFAKCYRAKFFLSYSFCAARFCGAEAGVAGIDRLATKYTVFGPAPRILTRRLTGLAEDDSEGGCVAFSRRLRDELWREFSI